MTHAESQNLIVDLAFGELDPARAAEVADHLAGCAECQSEKAALDEMRRSAAPLREVEEPSAGFDDRILAAARAQAQLSHDGNIGEVVEVQGSVRPLGLEAAHIDAHRAPALPPRRRPRWAMRAVLGGSITAAAVLALVVSTSLQSKQAAEQAARLAVSEKQFEIRVQPAPVQQAANEAVREARKDEPKKDEANEEAKNAEEAQNPVAAAREGARTKVALKQAPPLAKKASRAEPEPPPPRGMLQDNVSAGAVSHAGSGSGGDALGGFADKDTRAAAQAKEPPAPAAAAAVAKSEPARERKAAAVPQMEAVARHAAPVASNLSMATSAPPPPDAVALEQAAQQARHGGDYLRAAALYRQAAAAHREAGEPGAESAWDLAHAIECLAAVGQFEQARQVRAELAELYPAEKSAFMAAGRALREVDSPAAAVAAPPAKAAPRPDGKAKAGDDKPASTPADF